MKKINCILLVDDDPTTNFLNEELITELEIAEQIHIAYNGQEALDFINLTGKYKGVSKKSHPRPNLIFLDINMPLMDGFEFLEHYNKLPKSKKADIIIVFLTTSDSQKDKVKAVVNNLVADFIEKPLRKEELMKIRDQYFKEFP